MRSLRMPGQSRVVLTMLAAVLALGGAFGPSVAADAAMAGKAPASSPSQQLPERLRVPNRPQALDTACTTLESWQAGRLVPAFYAQAFEHAFDGKGKLPLFQLLLLADMLKTSTQTAGTRYLAEYWLYRVFYDLKLTELAHSGFASLVMRGPVPGAEVARQAALACLNRINTQFPSMILTGITSDKLSELPRSNMSLEAATDLARAKVALSGATADVQNEMSFLQGSRAHTALIKLLQYGDQSSEAEVLRNTIDLFRAYPYPEGFSVDPDAVYLMLGEAFYGFRKYDRSLRAFERVRNISNFFVQALLGKAWSQLQRNDYARAVSTSENLIVGGLKGVFAPEANEIVSISLNETCNFPEAIESINFYKKNYAKSNAWLQQWQAVKNNADLYQAATSYLRKQLRVPDRVASEWMRSAIFISGQDEINRIVDERDSNASITRRVIAVFDKKREMKWIPVRRDLTAVFEGSLALLDRREVALKRQINADLNQRTQRMVDNINEVSANLQLVESEIYSNMSEKMIADFHRPGENRGPAATGKKDSKSHESAGAVWDWGKYDVESDDKNEVWEDEIGFLRTDIKSRCNPR